MKLHKQVYIEGGGYIVNRTLCGRESRDSWDVNNGNNVAETDAEVTCKLCLNLMKDKKYLMKFAKAVKSEGKANA